MTKTTAILYSDFNCPFCYALGERLNALGLADRVEWRGVQHAPRLPIPMARASSELAEELGQEVAAILRLAPEVRIAVPRGKANTSRAIASVAAVRPLAPAQASAFKDAIYRRFWVSGDDISDPGVLSALAREAGLGVLPSGPEAGQRAARWQRDWDASGLRGVPSLLRDDGCALAGLTPAGTLLQFLDPTRVRRERTFPSLAIAQGRKERAT